MASSPPPPKIDHSSADEATPLLLASGAGVTSQSNEEPLLDSTPPNPEDDDTPLPKVQIALLCYARVVEPIAFFSIFPFINKMIYETGNVEEADVGFYSGLIESLFSLTQMLLMIAWGRAADRFGRKPILVFSLLGVAVATALFGLSRQIWQMIFFRCLAGLFAGTVVTIRSMLSENSTPKTQARAFSWFAFTSNCGIFVGPLIGGMLASPAEQYPAVFGKIRFFKDYPYALPTFVTGLIGLSAAIISALFVKETLTIERRASNKESPHNAMSTLELLKYPGVASVIFIYGHTMLLALAYTAIIPIFWYYSIALGGFGFEPFWISIFLGMAGLSQALWTLIAFTPLQHRFGSGGVLRGAAIVWPIEFAIWPLCNILLTKDWKIAFWIVAPVNNVMGSGVSMAFTAVQLALNDIAPSHTTLGTLNALALTVVSGLRAVAPALFASLYAAGARGHIISGHLAWVILVALALSYIVVLRWLPAKAEGKLKQATEGED